jgi:hypothetical protein
MAGLPTDGLFRIAIDSAPSSLNPTRLASSRMASSWSRRLGSWPTLASCAVPKARYRFQLHRLRLYCFVGRSAGARFGICYRRSGFARLRLHTFDQTFGGSTISDQHIDQFAAKRAADRFKFSFAAGNADRSLDFA